MNKISLLTALSIAFLLTFQSCNDDSDEVDCTALETSFGTKVEAWNVEQDALSELIYDLEEGNAGVTCNSVKEALKSFIAKSESIKTDLKKGASCAFVKARLVDLGYENLSELLAEVDDTVDYFEEYINLLCD